MNKLDRRALLRALGAGNLAAVAFPSFLDDRLSAPDVRVHGAAMGRRDPVAALSDRASAPVRPAAPEATFDARAFGAVGDGRSHPLSERFSDLAAARAVYPFAPSLEAELDWAGLQKALFAARAAGGGLVRAPAGVYLLSAALAISSNTRFEGDGMGATVLRPVRDGFNVFVNTARGHDRPDRHVGFADFSIYGRGDVDRRQNKDRHFFVQFVRHLRVHRVESLDCRYMALGFGRCDDVEIADCVVMRSARDAITAAGSAGVRIQGNYIRHCGDDAIAVHVTQLDGARMTGDIVITGNVCEDTLAIKCVGATRVVIADNVIRRPKAYGIAVMTDEGVEGLNDPHDVQISNNIVLDPVGWKAPRGRHDGIFLQLPRPSDGGMAAAPPGDYDRKSRRWVLPEEWRGQPAEGKRYPRGGMRRLLVADNIVAKTLPSVAKYSEWGLGRAFTSAGWVDLAGPATEQHMRGGDGIGVRGALNDGVFRGNIVSGFAYGINFFRAHELRDVVVEGNRFVRLRHAAVNVAGPRKRALRGSRIFVTGNYFDLDPFWENTAYRRADGSYRSDARARRRGARPVSLAALGAPAGVGVYFADNVLRNLVRPFANGKDDAITWRDNVFVMEPRAGGNHGGVRDPLPGALVIAEDCDPRSPRFGQIIGRTALVAHRRPREGLWLKGQFVRNAAPKVDGKGRIVLGWIRLTDGDGQGPGRDWTTVYAPTGDET